MVLHLFDPSTLPSLRALAILYAPSASNWELFWCTKSSALLPQLEAIETTFPGFWKLSYIVGHETRLVLAPRTIVEIESEALKTHQPIVSHTHHLRIITYDRDPIHGRTELLESVTRFVSRIPTSFPLSPLRSIYLDRSLQPKYFDSQKTKRLQRRLFEQAQKRNIEIVFESQPSDWTAVDSSGGISQEFWRRQRIARRLGE